MPANRATTPSDVERRIELALAMIELGAAVFPLAPGSKQPLIPRRKGGGGFLDAQRDPERARTFLSHAGHPNYGVVFPEGSDVLVLDLDGGDRDKRPGWQADWQRLYERLGPPGLTFIVRTPSGGRHAYYRWRSDLYGPMPAGDEMLGWTVRKPWKGYLVGPGSVVNGQTYEPVGLDQITDLPEAWARAALAEKARRGGHDAIEFRHDGPAAVQVGHRHAYLRNQARRLRGVGLSGDALFAAVMDLNRQLAEPKSEDEVRDAIGDVETKFSPDPIDPVTGAPVVSAHRDRSMGRNQSEPPAVLDDLPFYTALEVATMTPEIVDWAWRDYLAHGTIVEIVGPPKAGKTTLVFALVRSYLDGLPFLDRPTAGGPVVILTEQGQATLRAVLGRTHLAEREDVHFLFHRDVRGRRWPDVMATAVSRCRELGARLLVVDTLPAFAALAGDAENNAGDALEAMAPIQAAADEGLAVLLNRHRRKGPVVGDIAEEGRGSGAFSGAVDVVVSLRRKDGGGRPTVRVLVASSRFDETPSQLFIELEDGRFVVLGDDAAVEANEARSAVLLLLDDHADGLTIDQLIERTGKSRQTVQRVLTDLERTRDVERHGRGRKGDPHRFTRVEDRAEIVSAQTLTPYGGVQSEGSGQKPPSAPTSSPAVSCHFYSEHQSRHERIPGTDRFRCRICSPEEEDR